MEKETRIKLNELYDSITSASWAIEETIRNFDNLEMTLRENNRREIKDIDNLKRELKRDGLYSEKIQEFLENYMRYYNK